MSKAELLINENGRKYITTNTALEKMVGFGRAVIVDGWIYMSATSGKNLETGALRETALEQAEDALENLRMSLRAANCDLSDVVKFTVIVPNPADVPVVRPVVTAMCGTSAPAVTVLCCNLPGPDVKIEIEAIVRQPS